MLWALESAIVSTLVELQNVTKTYGPVRALVGVSCSFTEGTVSVVRGANGSGKSTLLGIVGTVIRPSSGRVDHGGLGGSRAAVRRNVGWVGHDTLCYPELTGRQNIEFAARLYGIEADDFAACVAGQRNPRVTREDSVGNMRVLDQMRRTLGVIQ